MQQVPQYSSPPAGQTVIVPNFDEDRARLARAKRGVKVTSICHIVLGMILMVFSLYSIFTTRESAAKVMKSLKEDYGVEMKVDDQYMSRDELEIYDKFKNYNIVQLLVSMPIIILGKMGLKAIRCEKSKWAFWIQRKGRRVLFCFFILMLVLCYQCYQVGQFFKRMMPKEDHRGKHDWGNYEKFMVEPTEERLSPNDDCEPITSAGECDAKAECTWCVNFAVPSECWLIEDAKKLPPTVYNCDKLGLEEMTEDYTFEQEVLSRRHPHHDHDKHDHDKKHHGPPCCVAFYPLILFITMIAHRCYLCRYCYTFKKLEAPFIAIQAQVPPTVAPSTEESSSINTSINSDLMNDSSSLIDQ